MQQDSSKSSPIQVIGVFARQTKTPVEYHLQKESGPAHAKLYTVRLRLGEKEYIGVDRSIKLAQRAAARTAVEDLKQLSASNNLDDKSLPSNVPQLPTVVLNTWAGRHHIPIRYVPLHEEFLPPLPNSPWARQMFDCRLFIGQNLYFDGHGSSRAQSRQDCAFHALNFLRENPMSMMVIPPSTSTEIPIKSPISIMYERAKHFGLSVQTEYHEPFAITYHIGEHYSTTGTSSTKQQAKLVAAEKMLQLLPIPEEKSKPSCNKRTNQHYKFIEQKGFTDYSLSHEMNPITRVNQLARARNVKIQFEELEKLSDDKRFHFHVAFGEETCADGYGQSKKAAKRSAAENLLSKLNPDLLGSIALQTTISLPPAPSKGLLKRDEHPNKPHEKKHVHFLVDNSIHDETTTSDDPPSITIKQQLMTACDKLNIHIHYEDQLNTEDPQRHQSIVNLSIDDRLLAQFRGQAPSIEQAQDNASSAAWNNLQQLFNGSIPTPKSTGNIPYRRVETRAHLTKH